MREAAFRGVAGIAGLVTVLLLVPFSLQSLSTSSLELELSTHGTDFVVGEPVLLRLDFRNVGDTAERLLLTFSPTEDFMQFFFRDEAGEVYSRVRGMSRAVSGLERTRHGIGLSPGQSRHGFRTIWGGRVPRRGLVFPEAGEYEIWCEFYGWRAKVASDTVRITVHAPVGDDCQAFESFTHVSTHLPVETDCILPPKAPHAVRHWREVFTRWPASTYAPYALFFLANYTKIHGDVSDALDLYEHLLSDLGPIAYTEIAEFHLAECYKRLGMTEEAEKLRAEAVRKYPGSDLANPAWIPHSERVE